MSYLRKFKINPRISSFWLTSLFFLSLPYIDFFSYNMMKIFHFFLFCKDFVQDTSMKYFPERNTICIWFLDSSEVDLVIKQQHDGEFNYPLKDVPVINLHSIAMI